MWEPRKFGGRETWDGTLPWSVTNLPVVTGSPWQKPLFTPMTDRLRDPTLDQQACSPHGCYEKQASMCNGLSHSCAWLYSASSCFPKTRREEFTRPTHHKILGVLLQET